MQTVPADRSVLGTGMERDAEPLLPAPPDLLVDGSVDLCVCLSGEGSSSIIGLRLPATVKQRTLTLYIRYTLTSMKAGFITGFHGDSSYIARVTKLVEALAVCSLHGGTSVDKGHKGEASAHQLTILCSHCVKHPYRRPGTGPGSCTKAGTPSCMAQPLRMSHFGFRQDV